MKTKPATVAPLRLPDAPIDPAASTVADLHALAATHKIRISISDRAGCFDLYWPGNEHVFAVSVRDAIEQIKWNVECDAKWVGRE